LDSHQHDQLARCQSGSYGSLDGQPNGHLGRIRRQQRSEHRREILCATRFHTHTHTDGNTDAVRAISYTITYADDNRYSNAGAASYSRSPASPYSTTTPVSSLYENQTHCSTPTSRREQAKNFGVRILQPAQFNCINSRRSACLPGFLCRRESTYTRRGGSCWRSNTPIIHESYATRRNPEYTPFESTACGA